MKKPLGIIFDCDGCLLDSEVIFLESLKKYLLCFDVECKFEDLLFVIGQPMTDIANNIISKYKLDICVEKFIYDERKVFNQLLSEVTIQPMDGLVDFVYKCKNDGIKLAIASSSQKEYVYKIVTKFGIIDLFDVIVTGEQVEKGKPEPDIYILVAEKLGIDTKDLMVIEDSKNGILAGKRANIFTIGYKGSLIKQDIKDADICIDSYYEIVWE